MDRSSDSREKRKQPRVSVDLSASVKVVGEHDHFPGVISNASETGLLVNTLRNMPPGKKVIIEVLLGKEGETSKFRAVTQIIWKDIGLWDDWEAYLYGLKFIEISEEDYLKLKKILGNRARVPEIRFVGKSDEKERLVIRESCAKDRG